MKLPNHQIYLLVNEAIYEPFSITPHAKRSTISRELFERIYFYYLTIQHSIKKPIALYTDRKSVNLDIFYDGTHFSAGFAVKSQYGFPNIIGADILPKFKDALSVRSVSEEPIINTNIQDAMARLRFYYKAHHKKPNFDENTAFFDIETIITFADELVKNNQFDDAISLLNTLRDFIDHKLNLDICNSRRMGAFLSARFFHTMGLAHYRLHRYKSAESYLLSAEGIYSQASPIGRQIYNLLNLYPY